MANLPLKPEDLEKIEEVTEDDLKSISGGKSVMPASDLQNYTLLKIARTPTTTTLADTTATTIKTTE